MPKVLVVALVLALAGVVLRRSGEPQGPPRVALPAAELDATISHGEEVRIEDHLEEGAWTLVVFGADW